MPDFQGPCPICGEKTVHKPIDDVYCEDTVYEILLCPNCTGEFSWPMKPMNYDSDPGRYQRYLSQFDSMLQESLRRSFYFSWGVTFLDLLESSRGNLLDVGSGFGVFLVHAYNLGFDTYGTEISTHAVDFLQKKLPFAHIALIDDTFDLPESWPDSYEVITSFDVLEHVRAPLELGKRIYRLLSPGGHLILAVPNRDRYYYKFHGLVDEFFSHGDYPPYHLTRWRKKTVEVFLRTCGFKDYYAFVGGFLWRRNLYLKGNPSNMLSSVPRCLYTLAPRMPLLVTKIIERLGTHLIVVARKDVGEEPSEPALAAMAEQVISRVYKRSIPLFIECEIK